MKKKKAILESEGMRRALLRIAHEILERNQGLEGSVKDYINMAGGLTRIAAEKEIYVIKVNGSAVSRRAFNWLGLGKTADYGGYEYHFGGLKSLTLDPGDTIVVPEKLERIAWLKEIKDITQILANVALTAGVIIAGLRR